MGSHVLRRTQSFGEPLADVFAFFADTTNLDAVTPYRLRVLMLTPEPITMRPGSLLEYRLRLRGVTFSWRSAIQEWDPPHRFVAVQVRGPFARLRHEHDFAATGDGGATMTDTIDYAVGRGPVGAVAHRLFVGPELEAIFDFRARAAPSRLAHTRAPAATR